MEKTIKKLLEECKKRLYVSCDEMHAHSVSKGCLVPRLKEDEIWLDVALLLEVYQELDNASEKLIKEFKKMLKK